MGWLTKYGLPLLIITYLYSYRKLNCCTVLRFVCYSAPRTQLVEGAHISNMKNSKQIAAQYYTIKFLVQLMEYKFKCSLLFRIKVIEESKAFTMKAPSSLPFNPVRPEVKS